MTRCVILDDYQDVATSYADWSGLDAMASTVHVRGDALVELLAGVEVVVAMRERTAFNREVLARLPDLRLLVTTGMRNASIDLAACAERGVTVCGTRSLGTHTVELTWALIHGLARRLVDEATALRGGGWQTTVGTDLAGARLGLVGLGKIGTKVAAIGRAYGMDVVAWSPHLTDERATEAGVTRVDKAELFATADIVSLHLVLSSSTSGIVGADELTAMRPTAYVVNTSRAALIERAALLAALDAGAIAGAGLDVWEVEPVPPGDRLAQHPLVLGTPHLGYVTRDNYRVFYAEAAQDVRAWLADDPLRVLAAPSVE